MHNTMQFSGFLRSFTLLAQKLCAFGDDTQYSYAYGVFPVFVLHVQCGSYCKNSPLTVMDIT